MALPTYSTGTASVAAGGTVVTGIGGLWSGTNAKQGDFISIGGSDAVLITEVTDATHLKVSPWPDAAKTSQPYIIYQNYVGRVVGVAAAEDVGDMLEKLHTDGLPFIVDPGLTVPDPSYGDDGQFAFQPTTGHWWTKTGGVWVSSPGLTGNVSGPGSAVADRIAVYNGTSGLVIKDGGTTIADLSPAISVLDYGAVGDWVLGVGGTNNASAFTAAVAAAMVKGKRVRIPAGKYLIGSAVSVPEGVWFQGDGWEEEPVPGDGTWLIVSSASFTPFALGLATRGTRFEDIAFYQTQPDTSTPGWTPTAYPPIINMADSLGALDIVDCFATNVTKFVRSYNSGRLYMRRVKGQVYDYLTEVDQALDVPMFDDIHIWPFSGSATNVLTYQQANCDVFRLMRMDSPMFGKIFVFGARSAFRLLNGASAGFTTKLMCSALSADFVKNAVWIESSGATGSFGTIEGQHEAWPSTGTAIVGASTLRISGDNCRFNVSSLRADRPGTSGVEVTGTNNLVQVVSMRVSQGVAVVPQGIFVASGNIVNLGMPPLLEGVTLLQNAGGGTIGYGAFSQGLGQVGLNFSYDSGGNRILFQPAGSTNVATQFYGDGTGHVGLGVSGNRIFRVDRVSNGDSQILMRSNLASASIVLESGSTNADINVAAKGTGSVRMSNRTVLSATTASLASLNVPQGTAPAAPADGDVWREDNTNTGLKVRINGVTKTITVT